MGVQFQEYGSGASTPAGQYRFSFKTGATTTISGGGSIFCFRWVSSAYFCRLNYVSISAGISTAFGTAQVLDTSLLMCKAWTTAPTAGVTLTAPTAFQNTMSDTGALTAMSGPSTLFPTFSNSFAVANTGALTTGSPTVDSNPIGYALLSGTAGVTLGFNTPNQYLYNLSPGFDYPLTLGNNEGLQIQLPTTQGATGVVVYYINIGFAANVATF